MIDCVRQQFICSFLTYRTVQFASTIYDDSSATGLLHRSGRGGDWQSTVSGTATTAQRHSHAADAIPGCSSGSAATTTKGAASRTRSRCPSGAATTTTKGTASRIRSLCSSGAAAATTTGIAIRIGSRCSPGAATGATEAGKSNRSTNFAQRSGIKMYLLLNVQVVRQLPPPPPMPEMPTGLIDAQDVR